MTQNFQGLGLNSGLAMVQATDSLLQYQVEQLGFQLFGGGGAIPGRTVGRWCGSGLESKSFDWQ